ncbi:MAG: hypothetical protein ACFFGZ_00270 [Candidatus Thorarchaeota archaeon]
MKAFSICDPLNVDHHDPLILRLRDNYHPSALTVSAFDVIRVVVIPHQIIGLIGTVMALNGAWKPFAGSLETLINPAHLMGPVGGTACLVRAPHNHKDTLWARSTILSVVIYRTIK